MKKTVSRLIALLLVGSMVFAGCSNTSSDTTKESGNTETTTTESSGEETTEEETSAEAITDLVIPKLATRE